MGESSVAQLNPTDYDTQLNLKTWNYNWKLIYSMLYGIEFDDLKS